jgi:hypothetical protein
MVNNKDNKILEKFIFKYRSCRGARRRALYFAHALCQLKEGATPRAPTGNVFKLVI